MKLQMNIFRKILLTIIVLMTPILLLFLYSNRTSERVVSEEINASSLKQLAFFQSQVETNVQHLNLFAVSLSTDSAVRRFQEMNYDSAYQMVEVKQWILEKLWTHNALGSWSNQLTVFSPRLNTGVTTLASLRYEEKFGQENISTEWVYRPNDLYVAGGERYTFVKHQVLPKSAVNDIAQASLIVEVGFTEDNIVTMLDHFKRGGKGDPFFYHPDYMPITNRSVNKELIPEVIYQLRPDTLGDTGSRMITLEGEDYLVNYVRSDSLGWHLIDYLPVQEILLPITVSRYTFYGAAGLLVIFGIVAAYLLYRNVQVPIVQLIRSVQRLKMGDYSVRIDRRRSSGEFDFLFNRFNEMAEQIQELFEQVYQATMRTQEATLKQLQSQINPHFLYNCFAFIKSMAQLGKTEPVVEMALNLSKYYRYTTRVETQTTTIREELALIGNYLTIQQMQMQRFTFRIEVPERMLDVQIPRLLIQPIVENAVVHGIEPMESGKGEVYIYGVSAGGEHRIVVEDNGAGIGPVQLMHLQRTLQAPLGEEMGCGLWNVNQRLVHQFGKGAGLDIASSASGGCIMTLRWTDEAGEERGAGADD
ncbi:histidine kinase [Paenibacillus sp. 1P07SE]|uniref:histidine kinase n=1 Tax=Paenibacillus sp. 1P07SE TaxID=3132209 RepID=UPI0039A51342